MAAPTEPADLKKSLANPEAPHMAELLWKSFAAEFMIP
jgi:hypothetical protein